MAPKTLIAGGSETVARTLATSFRLQGRIPSVVRLSELDQLLTDLPRSQTAPELIVLVEDSDFERTLTSLRRLRSATAARLVTVGESADARRILESVRAGSDDYLALTDNLDNEIGKLLGRLTGCLNSRLGQVVSIVSANGGCGCSTLAASCAATLAQEHGRCALLDLQPWTGDLASLLDVRPKHSVADLLLNLDTIDSAMLEQSMHKHDNGVHLLAAPQQYPETVQFRTDEVMQILKVARQTYSHVILDVQDCFHDDQLKALELSDVILLLLRLDFVSLRNTRRAIEHLGNQGIDPEKIELVANRYGLPRQLSKAQAEEALRRKIQHIIPDDSKRVIHAMNCGVPVVLEAPSSKVARCIRQLANSLVAHNA